MPFLPDEQHQSAAGYCRSFYLF